MTETVFERAGGEEAFLRLAAALHERCLADPVLAHPFSHADQNPEHVERLGRYLAEVFGGPPWYTTEAGGHSAMLSIHASTGAEDDLGRRFVAAFVAALDDAEIPDDPALRDAMRRYIEAAVDEVMAFSPRGSEVPAGLSMPRWQDAEPR